MTSAAKQVNYESMDDRDILVLIKKSREGINYSAFNEISRNIPLKTEDWSRILHLSDRTLQRYKKEKTRFSPIYSEKIFEVQLLFNKGIGVFGGSETFYNWLNTKNVALGGILPVSLLDNSFGILMVKDELTRIEQGVLA